MICKHILSITYLNDLEIILCIHLNGFKYFYLIQIILFTINHQFNGIAK